MGLHGLVVASLGARLPGLAFTAPLRPHETDGSRSGLELFGSGNWDPRSLRLNFEFDIECYDLNLAETLYASACAKRDAARQTSLQEVDSRSIPVRLRDGVARLLTPYL